MGGCLETRGELELFFLFGGSTRVTLLALDPRQLTGLIKLLHVLLGHLLVCTERSDAVGCVNGTFAPYQTCFVDPLQKYNL